MDKRDKTITTPPLFLLKAYKKFLSPVLVMLFGDACRFQPSCSVYARQAVSKHGFVKGALMSSYRVLRCNPLNEGGFDPA